MAEAVMPTIERVEPTQGIWLNRSVLQALKTVRSKVLHEQFEVVN